MRFAEPSIVEWRLIYSNMAPNNFFVVQFDSTNFSSLINSYLKYFKIVDPVNGQYIGYLILQFNMPDLLAPQPYKIVITRFFFPVLHLKLLRKIHGTMTKFLACVFP